MQLVETKKIYIPHDVTLGVPPMIDNLRCLGVKVKSKMDIFEYCDSNESKDLKNINGIYFK